MKNKSNREQFKTNLKKTLSKKETEKSIVKEMSKIFKGIKYYGEEK